MEVRNPVFIESYIHTPVVSARAGPLSPVLRDLHGSSFLVLINEVADLRHRPLSMGSSTAASGDFPIYPGERPSVADAKAWRLGSYDVMPSDWKALTAGIPPHSLVHLIALPVPALLVEDPSGPPIITVSMSLTRDMAIMDATQKNAVMDATRDSGMAGCATASSMPCEGRCGRMRRCCLQRWRAAHPLAGRVCSMA